MHSMSIPVQIIEGLRRNCLCSDGEKSEAEHRNTSKESEWTRRQMNARDASAICCKVGQPFRAQWQRIRLESKCADRQFEYSKPNLHLSMNWSVSTNTTTWHHTKANTSLTRLFFFVTQPLIWLVVNSWEHQNLLPGEMNLKIGQENTICFLLLKQLCTVECYSNLGRHFFFYFQPRI